MLIHADGYIRSLDEQIADMEDDNREIASKSRLYKQEELEDYDLAIGKRYSAREFLTLLTKCDPSLLIKDGFEGSVAIYRPRRRSDEPCTDLSKPEWWRDHLYVTGFPIAGVLNEFSSITTDSLGRPHREDRGWRTVLMALIQCRCITYNQVKRVFGEPTHSRGWRWHSELKPYKG